jgi:hypothetical protein
MHPTSRHVQTARVDNNARTVRRQFNRCLRPGISSRSLRRARRPAIGRNLADRTGRMVVLGAIRLPREAAAVHRGAGADVHQAAVFDGRRAAPLGWTLLLRVRCGRWRDRNLDANGCQVTTPPRFS